MADLTHGGFVLASSQSGSLAITWVMEGSEKPPAELHVWILLVDPRELDPGALHPDRLLSELIRVPVDPSSGTALCYVPVGRPLGVTLMARDVDGGLVAPPQFAVASGPPLTRPYRSSPPPSAEPSGPSSGGPTGLAAALRDQPAVGTPASYRSSPPPSAEPSGPSSGGPTGLAPALRDQPAVGTPALTQMPTLSPSQTPSPTQTPAPSPTQAPTPAQAQTPLSTTTSRQRIPLVFARPGSGVAAAFGSDPASSGPPAFSALKDRVQALTALAPRTSAAPASNEPLAGFGIRQRWTLTRLAFPPSTGRERRLVIQPTFIGKSDLSTWRFDPPSWAIPLPDLCDGLIDGLSEDDQTIFYAVLEHTDDGWTALALTPSAPPFSDIATPLLLGDPAARLAAHARPAGSSAFDELFEQALSSLKNGLPHLTSAAPTQAEPA